MTNLFQLNPADGRTDSLDQQDWPQSAIIHATVDLLHQIISPVLVLNARDFPVHFIKGPSIHKRLPLGPQASPVLDNLGFCPLPFSGHVTLLEPLVALVRHHKDLGQSGVEIVLIPIVR